MNTAKWLTLFVFGSVQMMFGSITYSITDSWIDLNVGAQRASISVSVPDYITSPQTIECESCGQAGQVLTINDNLSIWGVQFEPTSPSSLSATILLSDRQYNTPGFSLWSSFAGVNGPGTYTVDKFVSSNLENLPLVYGTQQSSTLSINPEPSTVS